MAEELPDLRVGTLNIEERAGALHLSSVSIWLLFERRQGTVFDQVRQARPSECLVSPANAERQDGAPRTGRLDRVKWHAADASASGDQADSSIFTARADASLALEDALAHHPKEVNRLADVAPGEGVEDPVHGLQFPPGRLPVVHAEEAVGEEIVVIGSKPRPFVLRGPDGTRGGCSELLGDARCEPIIARAGFVLIPAGDVHPALDVRFGDPGGHAGALRGARRLTCQVEH